MDQIPNTDTRKENRLFGRDTRGCIGTNDRPIVLQLTELNKKIFLIYPSSFVAIKIQRNLMLEEKQIIKCLRLEKVKTSFL